MAGRNRVQITCNTSSGHRVQHAVCHVARRDSSAIEFDTVEIAFILALFYWLHHQPKKGACVGGGGGWGGGVGGGGGAECPEKTPDDGFQKMSHTTARNATYYSPKCHILQPEMPHTTARNATYYSPKCHILQPEMSHTTARNATYYSPKCHILQPEMPHTTARNTTARNVTYYSPKCHILQPEMSHTTARNVKPQPRLEPALQHWWQGNCEVLLPFLGNLTSSQHLQYISGAKLLTHFVHAATLRQNLQAELAS